MRELFSINGRFFRTMGKVADLFLVTLLWIVGCLPVVTIVASTASLYYVVVKCIRYDTGTLFAEFKGAYLGNLRQGVCLTLLFGVTGALIGYADYRVYTQSAGSPSVPFIAAVGLLVLSLVYLLNLLWIAPVFSRFADSLGRVLKLNYVIAMRNLPRSVPMLLLIAAAAILILALNELVFILPAVVVLVQSLLAEPAMRRYMPPRQGDDADWRYGDR